MDSLNPHIRDKHSPLEILIQQALRRYGEFAAETIDGEAALMFIEFANMVIDEVNAHPYHQGDPVPYYTALSDARGVPDPAMIAGLLYHFSVQQGSQKIEFYMPAFFRSLNQHMWMALNGNTTLQARIVDDGTSLRNQGHKYSKTNGKRIS